MTNYIEQKTQEYRDKYKGILPEEAIEAGAEWYREALERAMKQGREEMREAMVVALYGNPTQEQITILLNK